MWKAFIIASLFIAGSAAADTVNVTSDQATYSADGKQANFSGNVVVHVGEITVHADTLVITVGKDGNHYTAEGAPVRAFCMDCGQAPLLATAKRLQLDDAADILSVSGNVTICAGDNCVRGHLTADSGVWRRRQQQVRFVGAPVQGKWWRNNEKTSLTFRAGKVNYNLANGNIVMEREALLSRDGSEIRGNLIHFNTVSGTLRADGGKERVRAIFGADE